MGLTGPATKDGVNLTRIRRGATFLSILTAGALALTACGSGGGDGGPEPGANQQTEGADDGGTQDGTITVAVDEEYTAYNDDTAEGNGTWNSYVHNGVKNNFWSFGDDGSIVREEEFGTYEKTSDDPLTVEYSINEETAWSDGTPIDCDDILLEWASMSGKMVDGEGNNIFNPSSTNIRAAMEKPECEPGDKEFTIVYSQPHVDWELGIEGGNVPAHIAAEQGGLSPEELVTAIQEDDVEALQPVAEFWNTAWQFNPGELPDPELIPSSGPYLLDSWEGGQSVTLVANPDYYGTPPATETIVLRLLDSTQQTAALENGEVDVINPSNPTPDVASTLESLTQSGPFELITGGNLTWSHIDLQQGEGRVFEPLEVRQAFAKCVPRQLIVDNLIKPGNPDAVTQDLREFFPADDDYDEAREVAFPEEEYGEVDVEGAADLLAQAGVETPVEVRLMHADDPTRNDLSALVKDSCDQAGFNISVSTPPDWGERITGDTGSYDAMLFGWAGSGVLGEGQSLYQTGGDQNPYGYSNERVDELWDQIVRTTDRDEARQLLMEMEAELWQDVFNIPLYTNANIVAHSDSVEGVVLNQAQTGVTFNMDEWSLTG